jgi:hypothetical protein
MMGNQQMQPVYQGGNQQLQPPQQFVYQQPQQVSQVVMLNPSPYLAAFQQLQQRQQRGEMLTMYEQQMLLQLQQYAAIWQLVEPLHARQQQGQPLSGPELQHLQQLQLQLGTIQGAVPQHLLLFQPAQQPPPPSAAWSSTPANAAPQSQPGGVAMTPTLGYPSGNNLPSVATPTADCPTAAPAEPVETKHPNEIV